MVEFEQFLKLDIQEIELMLLLGDLKLEPIDRKLLEDGERVVRAKICLDMGYFTVTYTTDTKNPRQMLHNIATLIFEEAHRCVASSGYRQ